MPSRLRVENLSKSYEDGTIVAVNDMTLELAEGEFVVFVGPSGCGKSTTLRCIAGLETPTEGEILLDDVTVTSEPPRRRDIAMVFQDYALFPHMTARQNMSFPLRMGTDLPSAEVGAKVDEVAEMMGIEELLSQPPSELSGGQQQRVALGRAIVQNPKLFLMDEPLSNLDENLRQKMRSEIKQLQQELDVTTIYVTHNQDEAMTMADRIVVLKDGTIQQIGTPRECYLDPANEFVASFIGSPGMNFLDVEYDGEPGVLANDRGFIYRLSDRFADSLASTPRQLRLGVRPEALDPVDSPEDADLTARVELVEPHGDITHVTVSHDAGSLILTTVADHMRNGRQQFDVGEDVHLRIPESALYLFDRRTGESLLTSRSLERIVPSD